MKNWRPITLLNVFYKIISGVISKRIKSKLGKLISNSQSGFMKGRYIGENTRLIYDLMSHTELNNIPGLLVFIDFEKAFDSVSWSFVYKVLKFFGFQNYIINWIKILNNNIKASVIQSGFLSEQISIHRGCRQGDPIAPYLFLLTAEILGILIKNNTNINGIIINNKEHKISQYADDTSLILDGSKNSLFSAIDTLELYARISGLHINSSKTKIVWIGSKKFSKDVYHHSRWKFDWGSSCFTLLGIQFSVNLDEMISLNFNEQLPKIKSLLCQWNKRILTPIGKITVVKTLAMPKLNHLLTSLPNPEPDFIKVLESEFFKFIWGSKSHRIKKALITQNYNKGGLKMVDVENFISSLKCSWMKRALFTDHKHG